MSKYGQKTSKLPKMAIFEISWEYFSLEGLTPKFIGSSLLLALFQKCIPNQPIICRFQVMVIQKLEVLEHWSCIHAPSRPKSLKKLTLKRQTDRQTVTYRLASSRLKTRIFQMPITRDLEQNIFGFPLFFKGYLHTKNDKKLLKRILVRDGIYTDILQI